MASGRSPDDAEVLCSADHRRWRRDDSRGAAVSLGEVAHARRDCEAREPVRVVREANYTRTGDLRFAHRRAGHALRVRKGEAS